MLSIIEERMLNMRNKLI